MSSVTKANGATSSVEQEDSSFVLFVSEVCKMQCIKFVICVKSLKMYMCVCGLQNHQWYVCGSGMVLIILRTLNLRKTCTLQNMHSAFTYWLNSKLNIWQKTTINKCTIKWCRFCKLGYAFVVINVGLWLKERGLKVVHYIRKRKRNSQPLNYLEISSIKNVICRVVILYYH